MFCRRNLVRKKTIMAVTKLSTMDRPSENVLYQSGERMPAARPRCPVCILTCQCPNFFPSNAARACYQWSTFSPGPLFLTHSSADLVRNGNEGTFKTRSSILPVADLAMSRGDKSILTHEEFVDGELISKCGDSAATVRTLSSRLNSPT
uniref:Uncharacterized protein n=1 Tax=Caenorhabditis japonica TaxID=281687 RepID=A0A8R1IJ94_CAEJA